MSFLKVAVPPMCPVSVSRFHLSGSTVVLLVALTLSGCRYRSSEVTVAGIRAQDGPDQESWDTRFLISVDGLPRIRLTAPYMARYERPDSTYMVLTRLNDDSPRVRVDLFDVVGDSSAVIHADRIEYYEREHRFIATGDVRVRTVDGRRLQSEHLSWDERDRKIRTSGFAHIVLPNRSVTGFGLTADENLADFSMTRVTGVFLPDESNTERR